MIHLTKMIGALRQQYEVNIQTSTMMHTQEVNQILFWNSNIKKGNYHTLYISEYIEDFPNDFYWTVLFINAPPGMHYSRHIYISSQTPLDICAVYNVMQGAICQQLAINLKKEELFEALQASAGFKSLVQVAYSYLENPIKICDTSFTIIHRIPEEDETDDIMVENGRMYVKDSSIASMQSEKLVDRLFHAQAPFYSDRDSYEYQWLYSNIKINNAVVGYICIQGKNRSFTDEDIDFTDIFASMLSVEMQKSDFFMQKTGLLYEYFLNDLLSGHFNNEKTVRKRLNLLGRKLGKYFWILAFFYEMEESPHITPGNFIQQMCAIFPKGMTIFYSNVPIVFASQDNDRLFQSYQYEKLKIFLEFNHMNCAASYCFTNLLDAPHFYKQAIFCGDFSDFSKNRIVYYEDYAIEHILYILKHNISIESIVYPKVRWLLKYDEMHNTDFTHTLCYYLANGGNASKTAADLGIHKSTLSYRIKKIMEITNLKLDDTRQHLLLDLSLKFITYLKNEQ